MSKIKKRFFISLAISFTGILITYQWYKYYDQKIQNFNETTPIARVSETSKDVQRKPLRRLIWDEITISENIYNGEQIRTGSDSQAKIEFVKSGIVVSLEEKSLVTIEEKENEVALDFLQGNLFVKSTGVVDQKLTIKSGEQTINATGAEVLVEKNEKGRVELEVLKGKLQSDSQKKKIELFEIIRPEPLEEIFLSDSTSNSVVWEWKRKNEFLEKVSLLMGLQRSDLKEVGSALNQETKIIQKMKPGLYYWKLVGESNEASVKKVDSSIYKIKVHSVKKPNLIYPEQKADLKLPEEKRIVRFKWTNVGGLIKQKVEISKSETFTDKVISKAVENLESYDVVIPENGEYHWRVSGNLSKMKDPVFSSTYKFSIGNKVEVAKEVPQVILDEPKHEAKLPWKKLNESGLILKWNEVKEITSYKLFWQKKGTQKFQEELVKFPFIRLNAPESGEYEWFVTAVNSKGVSSKNSEIRKFIVEKIVNIAWKNRESKYFYWTEVPEIQLSWFNDLLKTAHYKVTVQQEEKKLGPFDTQDAMLKIQLPNKGVWSAYVEAFDDKKNLIGQSDQNIFEVVLAPLLEAPKYEESVLDPVTSDRKGDFQISWSPLADALNYVVEIRDEKDRLIVTEETKLNKIEFRKFKPGPFKATVLGVDRGGRRGIASESRNIIVPELSFLKSPKIEKIVIKNDKKKSQKR